MYLCININKVITNEKKNFTWSYKTQPWQELIIIDLKCYLPFICFDLDACLKINKRMYIPYLFSGNKTKGLTAKQVLFIRTAYAVTGGSVYAWSREKRKVFPKYKCDAHYVSCFNPVLWNVHGVDLNWHFRNKHW